MEMTGEYRISAAREDVWAALNDTEVLKRSLRGCEALERIDDTHMKGTVTSKVGPVKATFKGQVTLSEIDPPNGYRIAGEGSAGPAGYAKGGAKVSLRDDGDQTVLAYTVDASIGGKIAQIGSRIVDAAAKRMADDFFKRFSAELDAQQSASEQSAPSSEPDPAVKQHSYMAFWVIALGIAGAAFVYAAF